MLVAYLRSRRARYPDHIWLFDDGRGQPAQSEPHALATAFRRPLAELGCDKLDSKPIHGFRANFATISLNELCVDCRTVARLLDHSSCRSTGESHLAVHAKEKRRSLALYEWANLHSIIAPELQQNDFST